MLVVNLLVAFMLLSLFFQESATNLPKEGTTWETRPTWATTPDELITKKWNRIGDTKKQLQSTKTTIFLTTEPTVVTKRTTTFPVNKTSGPHQDPKPITLHVQPNLYTRGNLTCIASGQNLIKIRPYRLIWFEQGDGGYDKEIVSGNNCTKVILEHDSIKKLSGKSLFCALIFNQFSPKHYWKMQTEYIYVPSILEGTDAPELPVKLLRNTASKNESNKDKAVIGGLTGGGCLLALVVVLGLFCKRLRNRNTHSTPPVSEAISSASENIYTYVPVQTVSFYEAKAMAAANVKIQPEAIKPPPLPARP